jgi:hypothetical protein
MGKTRFESRVSIHILATILRAALPILAHAAKTERDKQSGQCAQQNILDWARDALRRYDEGYIR